MNAHRTYRIIGVESSPYSVKLRSVFRYRRIAHLWQSRMPQMYGPTEHLRPLLMPVLAYPDGTLRTDSTPLIYDLERRHPEERSVIVPSAGYAFLSHLIEDMADEWLTKVLFYYRFHTERDGRYAAGWVQDDAREGLSQAEHASASAKFYDRQRERRALVGAVEANRPIYEQTYRRVLGALELGVANERFLFGTRPSLGDFGLIGQLSTLACDLTSGALMRQIAPRTESWTRRGHDLSGVEGCWGEAPSPMVEDLLRITAQTYLPFLRENARAADAGREEVALEILGQPYRQTRFGYQVKCLAWLREEFAALEPAERGRIEPMLRDTDCWSTFDRA